MAFRIRFQVSIMVTIVLIIAALTAAIVSSLYVISSRVARDAANQLFGAVAQGVSERIDNQVGSMVGLTALGAVQATLVPIRGDGLDAPILPFAFTALAENTSLYSLYYGLDDGSFFQVIAPRGEETILSAHKAPAATRWIVRIISGLGAERTEKWWFLDGSLRVLGATVEARPDFDPRQRPWYVAAQGREGTQLSDAYVFHSLGRPGITSSRRFAGGVFGVDMTLAGLEEIVRKQEISAGGGVVVFDKAMRVLAMSEALAPQNGSLVALSNFSQPMIQALTRLLGRGEVLDGLVVAEQDGVPILLRRAEWQMAGFPSIGIVVVAPVKDFTGKMRSMQANILIVSIVCLAVFLVAGVVFARGMSVTVRALAEDALRIRQMDFSGAAPRTSHIIEFNALGDAFHLMKQALAARTRALEDALNKLARLVEVGIALASEHDVNRLMETVLLEAKALTNADGGTFYKRGDDDRMHFQIFHNDTLGMVMGGSSGRPIDLDPVPLFDGQGRPNEGNVVSRAVHRRETIVIEDAYDSSFDFSGPREFDAKNGYRSQSFLTVPLKPRGGEVIGALQLVNARAPGSNEPMPFSSDVLRFIEALAAQAATALSNRDLLSAQDRLIEAIIQLIASAIDAKSPYTGSHCERVPELALMLATEASNRTEGPLADFRLETDQEWREFRIGAWLHDCGKVVTPEHIVDKATKLEAIYNRIHEVRMRYEVLLRDADIVRLEAIAAGEDPAAAQAACDAAKARLLDDFAFVAECNVGSEDLPPDKMARLADIAKTIWIRHIDDRAGLAHSELRRLEDTPVAPLPALETVLADKPWHVIARHGRIHRAYEGMGFRMPVPENLSNRGEVYNLSVGRGTLTAEDRFTVNEHVMQTIAMLERLPFPKHLKRVPEYAGTHHEALDGTGYPRKLDARQLSVPSRIMAIADIFEALTAADRPYKRAKTLSEAVELLHVFKKKGHIDPDLFDLFLTSGAFRRYAERFLKPEQIDAVDVGKYVSAV